MNDEGTLQIEGRAIGIDRRERYRRLGRWGLAGSGLMLVVSTALALATNDGAICLIGCSSPLAALGSLLLFAVGVLGGLPTMRVGSLSIDAGALTFKLRDYPLHRSVPVGAVVQGWSEDPDRVHLALPRGEVLVVQVPDAPLRERILRAVGVTAAGRILRVPLASAASQHFGGTMLALIVLAALLVLLFTTAAVVAVGLSEARTGAVATAQGLIVTGSIGLAALSAASYALSSILRQREVVVGADGLVFHRSFRQEPIPYAGVHRVAFDPRGVRVTLRDGRQIALPTSTALRSALPVEGVEAEPPRNEADTRRRLLFARIFEAMNLERGGSAPGLAQLDRGERSLDAWRKSLRALATAADDYRRRALSTADLGAVIDDHAAPVERRIAAAVALSAREPEEARRRVRVAARVCADEALAAALEQAAEGEIAEAVIARDAERRRAGEPGR